ncbi:MAG: MoxR family ATPase [Clostridiales bacterium]|nr:MoxR family ATPase [Clostridiales bacterium]MCF8021887.1 MoxR family ATPase [Clostridiales bacterium]
MRFLGVTQVFKSIENISDKLYNSNYLADRRLAISVFLAEELQKPLLVEGPAGVGKTELGKALSRAAGISLIRMQCYEGLDEAKSLYEWNYQKQLLYIQNAAGKTGDGGWEKLQQSIYTEEFLLPRPLLKALRSDEKVVLLIDELDKSDDEFESFLLEALSEYQVTIPEYGTITAVNAPLVVLTSNSRRELSDALKRRCLHLYIDYPSMERELQIVKMKVPGINEKLAEQLVKFVQSVRNLRFTGRDGLKKPPGISETIDWARSLLMLQVESLDKETVSDTLSVLLKYLEDTAQVEKRLAGLMPG